MAMHTYLDYLSNTKFNCKQLVTQLKCRLCKFLLCFTVIIVLQKDLLLQNCNTLLQYWMNLACNDHDWHCDINTINRLLNNVIFVIICIRPILCLYNVITISVYWLISYRVCFRLHIVFLYIFVEIELRSLFILDLNNDIYMYFYEIY